MIRMASGIEKSTATGEEVNTMRINYGATDRKRMVKAIGEALDEKPVYQGIPSYAYQIAEFTVTRDGNLEFPDDTDTEIVNGLIDSLEEVGFKFPESDANDSTTESVGTEEKMVAADTDTETADAINGCAEESTETDDASNATADSTESEETSADEPTELTISLPLMPPDALDRLRKLVDGKASLIQKALNADQLTIHLDGDKISFPWWKHMPEQNETVAYMAFLAALCWMARDAKRVTETEKLVESQKYAFRIFLIRLGFNGKENAAVRKILLQRLSGNAAFRNAEEEWKFREHRKALAAAMEHQEATVAREGNEEHEVTADETAE